MNEPRFTLSDRLFLGGFCVFLLLNLLSIAYGPLELAPDEAHYAEWSKRIDWAYYSKGPGVAALIRASTFFLGYTTFAVRLPAVICFAFFSFIFYLFSRELVGSRMALAAWLAMHSMLIFAQMGLLMTTDGPAALMWLIALICAYRAVVEEELPYWIGFGAAIGLGVLAKYTVGILFPSIFLLLFLTPHLRRHLIHPAFIAGTLIMCFVLFPLLKWNVEHGWANFKHNAGHVVQGSRFKVAPQYFLELVAGQLGLVGPIIFVGIVYALFLAIREWRQDDRVAGLLLFSSAPLAALVSVISFSKRVYANWPMPLYIGGLLLLTYLFANYRLVSPRATRLIGPGMIFSGVITVVAYLVFYGFRFGVPPQYLPTKKLVGWTELAAQVDEFIERHEKATGRRPFIVSTDYGVASEIAFYSKQRATVFCANVDGRRMNQYDIWDGWRGMRGRDAILVLKQPEVPPVLRESFRESRSLNREFPVEAAGKLLRSFYFHEAHGFNGMSPPPAEAR